MSKVRAIFICISVLKKLFLMNWVLNQAFSIQVFSCLVSEKTKTFTGKCLVYHASALSFADHPVRQSLPKTRNSCYRHWPYMPLLHLTFASPKNWKFEFRDSFCICWRHQEQPKCRMQNDLSKWYAAICLGMRQMLVCVRWQLKCDLMHWYLENGNVFYRILAVILLKPQPMGLCFTCHACANSISPVIILFLFEAVSLPGYCGSTNCSASCAEIRGILPCNDFAWYAYGAIDTHN